MVRLHDIGKGKNTNSILLSLVGFLHWFAQLFKAFNRRIFNNRPPIEYFSQEKATTAAPAEINGGELIGSNSVFTHLEQGLCRNPHGLAVICLHQSAKHLSNILPPAKNLQWLSNAAVGQKRADDLENCLTITYEQMHEAAQKLAAGLHAAGAKPNSKMLMLIPNGGEYALLMWCCIIMRITYVCVDPDIIAAFGYRSLKEIMRTVRPSIIITAGLTQAVALDIAIEDLNLSPPIRISLDDGVPHRWKPLADFVSSPSLADTEKLLDSARNDCANRIISIIFTSGTSGSPKGCPLRVGSMCHILESQSWLVTEYNSARALQAIHNSRGIAPFQTLQTWKSGGAAMMINDSGNTKQMTIALRHHRPTFIAVSPAMATAIRLEMVNNPFLAGSVRTVQLGGDAVTMGALFECATLFPQAKICINHGMTEGGGSFIWPFLETPIDQIPRYGELCPIGNVAPGSIVRIWDPSRRCVVRRGEVGHLHIRGGNLLRQYLGSRSTDSFFDDNDGRWFVTGDTAMIDRDGLVFILGRCKDMIMTGNVTIVPAAIETVIQKLTGNQSAVVPIHHAQLGRAPVAVVKDFESHTEHEIREHVTATLGRSYVLADVLSLRQIGLADFPKNGSGKISKVEIEIAIHQRR